MEAFWAYYLRADATGDDIDQLYGPYCDQHPPFLVAQTNYASA